MYSTYHIFRATELNAHCSLSRLDGSPEPAALPNAGLCFGVVALRVDDAAGLSEESLCLFELTLARLEAGFFLGSMWEFPKTRVPCVRCT